MKTQLTAEYLCDYIAFSNVKKETFARRFLLTEEKSICVFYPDSSSSTVDVRGRVWNNHDSSRNALKTIRMARWREGFTRPSAARMSKFGRVTWASECAPDLTNTPVDYVASNNEVR